MKTSTIPVGLFISLIAMTGCAAAYEVEDPVPFTISSERSAPAAKKVSILVKDRDVALTINLKNSTNRAQTLYFFGHSPLFHQLGIGEEHADKTFSELEIMTGSSRRRVDTEHRAFWRGRDITDTLRRNHLPVLPAPSTNQASLNKLRAIFGMQDSDEWEALVLKRWSIPLAQQGETSMQVRYQARPGFSRHEVGTPSFERLVHQHCGNVSALLSSAKLSPSNVVLVEKFVIQVQMQREVPVELMVQPSRRNWLGGTPLSIFACGEQAAATSAPPSLLTHIPEAGPISFIVVSQINE